MNSSFSIAVHALVYLNHMERVLSSEELAQNVCTNPVLVRKVMSKLKKAGIVTTKGGKSGGYAFASDAETLTLETIAEAIDAHFVGSPWRSGDMDKECLISSGIGLALVKEIVTMHKGTVRATNDNGAVFEIILPVK